MRRLIPLLLVAGCAGSEPVNTPSGQAEATLNNVNVACVRGQLANEVVNQGYTIRANTESMLVVGRPTRNTAASILLSTGMSGPPEERLQFTYISLAPRQLRIILQGAYVSNQGTGFEKATPVRASAAEASMFESKMQIAASRCP